MSENKFLGLKEGHEKFHNEIYPSQKHVYQDLVENGQRPEILMISCCDSRVDSAHIFSTGPGDLFMVRNVANLVPPCQVDDGHHGNSAAIEYAVTALKVKLIVVMGHSYCGGIKAAYESKNAFAEVNVETGRGFTHQWMDMIKDISLNVHETCGHLSERDQLKQLEQDNVLLSLKNLKTYKFVEEEIDAGNLKLVGAWFDLDQGMVHMADEASGKFAPLNES